jgi:hypothetical protein
MSRKLVKFGFGVWLAAGLMLGLAGRARADADATDYVSQWAVCGPFDNPNGDGAADVAYGPEKDMAKGIDVNAKYDAIEGKASWTMSGTADGVLNFLPLFPGHTENVVAYAYVLVKSPKDMAAKLSVGSDDGVKVFLNGVEVHKNILARGLTKDEDSVDVKLKAGDNHLLCKVLQIGGDWGLALRITKATEPVDGLTFSIGAAAGLNTPFVDKWLCVGPFDDADDGAFDKAYAPETKLDFAAELDGKDGKCKWKEAKIGDNGALNFLDVFQGGTTENVLCYAYVTLNAPQAMNVRMLLGSDDGVKVFLNGKQVHANQAMRALTIDQDTVDLKLNAGENPLLVKVTQGGGDWALAVRFTRTTDSLEGLKFELPKH